MFLNSCSYCQCKTERNRVISVNILNIRSQYMYPPFLYHLSPVHVLNVCMYVCMCVYVFMYDYIYVLFDYTYIDVNALAQGIKSCLASQVWFQAVAGVRTYVTDSPQLLVSHANHSATETSIKRMFNEPMIYVVTRNHAVHP